MLAGVLEHALVVEGTAELHVAALQALLALAVRVPTALQNHYSSRRASLQGFLGHTDHEGVPLSSFWLKARPART